MRAVSNDIRRRVLVGTIGYANLTNHSVGPVLNPHLRAMDWPAGVDVEEMNWGPIAIVQHLEALPYRYDRVVFLAATCADRPVGSITLRRWVGALPGPENIQARIGDAVTGVISLDNLLVIGEYFGVWPDEVIVVDVEPGPEKAGPDLSPDVASRVPHILGVVRAAALEQTDRLPEMTPLIGAELRRS